MLEFHALSPGDIYYSIRGDIPIWGENCRVITRINNSNHPVLLIDNQYYCMDTTSDAQRSFMITFQSLEEAKKHFYEHKKASFIKIAYNDIIGYVNPITLFQIESNHEKNY